MCFLIGLLVSSILLGYSRHFLQLLYSSYIIVLNLFILLPYLIHYLIAVVRLYRYIYNICIVAIHCFEEVKMIS